MRADLRKAVVVEVAQEDSWDREGGTKELVRLAMSLITKLEPELEHQGSQRLKPAQM